jgi:serine protease Do
MPAKDRSMTIIPARPRPGARVLVSLLTATFFASLPLPGCAQDNANAARRSRPSAGVAQPQPSTKGSGGQDRNAAAEERLREDMQHLVTDARDKVFPALVNIHVVTVSYWNGKEDKGAAVGSGTIFSPEGYVLTNQHVTNDGKKFRCTLSDKSEVPATLVGEDALTDLAVLKLDTSSLTTGGKPYSLPVASFGDSDALQVGEYVMAMGSPLALSRSVTLGIVSNTERVFTTGAGDELDEMQLEGQSTGLFTRWIQHDATINHGNSGGPLVNLRGQIVGVNELGGNNMAFAIPSNLARDVADALVKHGEVPRSAIGVSFRHIKRSGIKEGVLVNSVTEGAAADKAGIKAGDVITAIDGQPVNIRFPEEIPPLMRQIADRPIGSPMKFAYLRDGKSMQATLTTEQRLKDRGDQAALRSWGLSIQQIT